MDVWAYTPHTAGWMPCLSVRVCSINPVNTLNNKQSYKPRLAGHTPPPAATHPPPTTMSITLMLIAWLAALTWLDAKFKWTGSPATTNCRRTPHSDENLRDAGGVRSWRGWAASWDRHCQKKKQLKTCLPFPITSDGVLSLKRIL